MSGIQTGGNACLYGSAPRIRTSSCWKRENTNCQIKRTLFSKISRYAGALRFHLIGIWIWCWSRWLRRWFCCILLIKWGKFLLFSVNSNNFSQYFRSVSLSHRLSRFLPLTLHLSLCVLDWLHLGLHILSTFRSPLLHIRLRSARRPWAITVSLKGGWGDTGLINQSNFLSLCQRGEGGGGRWIEMDFVPSERISQGAPLPNGVRGCICWGSTPSPTIAELLFSFI